MSATFDRNKPRGREESMWKRKIEKLERKPGRNDKLQMKNSKSFELPESTETALRRKDLLELYGKFATNGRRLYLRTYGLHPWVAKLD